ncbi:MFS transporter [Armatimonas sp.]|uniref:MFS transporter n=1 Tax=Armatimonas sp. TaxID=1872638 RepID=UPI003750FEDD
MPKTTAVTSPHYKWAVVGMLWFICFFNYADRLAIFSVFPLLQKDLGFSKTELGVIGAAFTWVYAITAPFAGHVGDRMPRKWVILGGLYVWSLVTGLTAHCTRVIHFILVRGAEGLGETFYFPASMALISDYHSPRTRSRAIGLHQTSIYAGTIGGGALAGWMGEKYGWYSPFWVLAGAGIVLGFVLQRFIREPQRNQAEREEATTDTKEVHHLPLGQFLREFARTKTAVLLIVAYFGANLVGLVFLTWMPTFLTEKFHLKLAVAGLGATLFIQLASMVGSVLGGVIADRWSQSQVSGRILVQAVAALVGAPFIVLCGWTRDPWMLILAMSCFGLCKGMYDSNLTAAFYDVISPARRSTATGLMNLLGWLGAGLGSLVIGVAVDHGITMSVAISSTGGVYLAVAATLFAAARWTAAKDIAAAR